MTEQQIIETLATKVMGWSKWSECQWIGDSFCIRPHCIGEWKEWNPLENIADAWQVVEKLRERGILIGVETLIAQYRATIDGVYGVFAVTAPKAICKVVMELYTEDTV